jgi:predicted Zn-ribbon and HTH transcriptional regulator
MGGNGMGKTTLVNIIKYSLIGNYRKGFDLSRTYKDRKIEKRLSYPPDYFAKRQDKNILLTDEPKVTVEFAINNDNFVVQRGLGALNLQALSVNKLKINGKIVNQNKYDNLSDEDKSECLLYKFEEMVSKASSISFDDLIFFVNEILFFGENHATILWDDYTSNVQEELFNRYFNEPELNNKRQEANRQAKYFDSLSRHRSEDIRAIRNVLNKIEQSNPEETEETLRSQIIVIRDNLEKLEKVILQKSKDRKKADDQIRVLNNEINKFSQNEIEIEKEKKEAEQKRLSAKWKQVHKNYYVYFQNIKVNSLCPMCNQELDSDFVQNLVKKTGDCYLCTQPLVELSSSVIDKHYEKLNKQLSFIYNRITNAQKKIAEEEKKAADLDLEFRRLAFQKRELQSQLRTLEVEFENEDVSDDKLIAFYNEIERLQIEKDEFQEKSDVERERAEGISQQIEQHITNNTQTFSSLFAQFAERFLGVACSLTYTDQDGDGVKRFYPVIDGSTRYSEEELSESQRFFIDHSFRMSILSFFYTKPSFYIVETPNSSLDISYEKNAADVFNKFLEKPNTLIITTNLNNSDFLIHLTEGATKVSYINLLDIGKKSSIQDHDASIKRISNKIIGKIKNER